MESFCEKTPYHIPQLYIEGYSSEYTDDYLVEAAGLLKRSKKCPKGAKCYGKAIYGTILGEIIDIFEKKAKKSFIVVFPPEYTRGILVEAGTPLEPLPVEGVSTIIAACEGDEVEIDTPVGLSATGKQEIRKIRSHVKGVIVYIYSNPESRPEENIVFVAPKESVKHVVIQ